MFQSTVPIEHDVVAKILAHHWKIQLGKLLKASQNHTFEAYSPDKTHKFSVRITPDPHNKHLQRILDQIFFVNYLSKSGLNHICRPIPPVESSEHGFLVQESSFIIVVFQWAQGEPPVFTDYLWLTDPTIVKSWGRFFAQLHSLSRNFEVEHPQVALRIQRWNQVHNNILADVVLHPDDQKQINNPQHYGVIHGDLNISNLFYVSQGDHLSVFDTDQVQRGFYLWDLSQPIFTPVMFQEAGFPITCTPVPQANRKQFEEMIVAGYESVAGEGSVDRARLDRMVSLKKDFYRKFCVKAAQEGNIPADMAPFIQYVVNWLDKKEQA